MERLELLTLCRVESTPVIPPGGQHVTVPSGGIKITHIASGLTASCDAMRSQIKNRDTALSMIEWGLSEIGHDWQGEWAYAQIGKITKESNEGPKW